MPENIQNTNPNPTATPKKKFDLHKVFAAIGVILIVLVLFGAGLYYFVQNAENKSGNAEETTTVKVSTSSAKAKTATNSASASADTK